LRHIWGDGGCNVDDFVSDTPEAGGPNYTGGPCTYPGPNSCTPKGRPGQADDFDMFQNYMDYSDDVCMNLFTIGQTDRMWAAINASRPGLLSAACNGTPPPPPPATEICDNNIDDDGDGLVDCADPDCGSDPNCSTPGTCDAPTGLTHTRRKGGQEALLGWNATAGASSYDVEVYNASGALHASGTIAGTSATVGGLTKNAAYTWRVRANCTGSTSAWTDGAFTARLGNSNSLTQKEIFAFPNPSNQGFVNLTWDLASDLARGIYETNASNDEAVFIQMFDINGKTALSLQADNGARNQQLDVSNLADGMYIIQITNNAGYTARLKFLKQ
jgi:hypothetical protein